MDKEILFEFISGGNVQKATAIDPKTQIEVSIVAPLHVSRMYIEKVLLAKLKKKILKENE